LTSSFYPAHHISTGEGGMVCTDIPELKKLFMSFLGGVEIVTVLDLRIFFPVELVERFDNWLESYNGIIDHKYLFTNMGYNLKPLDLQGSIGLVQLTRFKRD
jgi:CDP-6-deoxy-D-xylo-4-hexulose-3-dehydrase